MNDKFLKPYNPQGIEDKIYKPMQNLIGALKANGFEIWIITASPQGMYQQFLSKALDITITHIVLDPFLH